MVAYTNIFYFIDDRWKTIFHTLHEERKQYVFVSCFRINRRKRILIVFTSDNQQQVLLRPYVYVYVCVTVSMYCVFGQSKTPYFWVCPLLTYHKTRSRYTIFLESRERKKKKKKSATDVSTIRINTFCILSSVSVIFLVFRLSFVLFIFFFSSVYIVAPLFGEFIKLVILSFLI